MKEYPKMLYIDMLTYTTVFDKDQEASARDNGYAEHDEVFNQETKPAKKKAKKEEETQEE